ncbi:ATP-binding protein [Actinosynnema sp. NPDC050436]|uniref:ATP-binding protein n=1 Tax=Actinosynnema sp. NPDC050436 TaxID=3155659 RepID=UPI0033FBFD05
MNGERDEATPFRNPFSTMAVSRVATFDRDLGTAEVTVQTDGIRRAVAALTGYLDAPPTRTGDPAPGTVLLIVGEHGTGKSHLARYLVRRAASRLEDRTRSLYLEATAENVLRAYQRLLGHLGVEQVRARVSDFYADIVAEQLQDTGLAGHAVELLRRREVEPHEVVRQLRLMESELLRRVHRKLSDVTENEDFGLALSLLLRPGFETAVWGWLNGEPPAPVLTDRDILDPISGDLDVLEAMGVVALLFGDRERRFVLAIDEFDKIFPSTEDRALRLAFQKMLEVFSKAGACLVLCGQPDFVFSLDPGTAERITTPVRLTGLSAAQVRELVELAQEAEFGSRRLEPFSPGTVEYVAMVTGGNVRKVIRMCHALYQAAHRDADGLVTDEMVREVAREQLGPLSPDEIVLAIHRVLEREGWSYQPDHYLSLGQDARVDFWLTFQDRSGGCAVIVTDSVLTEADAGAVRRRVSAVTGSASGAEVVLVVNGVVAAEPAHDLRVQLGRKPLLHNSRSFAEDLAAAIRAAANLLPGKPGGDRGDAVRQRIDQINRQQSSLYGFVEQLAEHIDGLRTSSDRRLAEIQQQLTGLTGTPEPVEERATAPGLPVAVARLFDDVLAALEEVAQTGLMMRQTFAGDDEAPAALRAVQNRQESAGYLEAVGTAEILKHALVAFQDAVLRWHQSDEVLRSAGELPKSTLDALYETCRTYDGVIAFLPLHKLEPLIHLTPWTAPGGTVTDLGRPARRYRLRDLLEDVSAQVRRASVRVASPGRG